MVALAVDMVATLTRPSANRLDVGSAITNALHHTRNALFRPAQFSRWLEFGFVFFLASLVDPSLALFRAPASHRPAAFPSALPSAFDPRWIFVLALGAAVAFVVIATISWVGCRGVMMSFESVRRSDVDLRASWRGTREPANGLFRTYLVVWLVTWSIAIPIGVLGALRVMAARATGADDAALFATIVPHGIVLASLLAALALVLFFIRCFVAPTLLHFGGTARAAWSRALGVVSADLGGVIMLLLARVVLAAVIGVASVAAVVGTCFLGVFPIIHQTVLAPLYFFDRSLTLHTLQTLGGDYADIVH